MVFDKLFAWRKKKKIVPGISFGRYSDNNKSIDKVNRWTEGDNLFKQQKFHESLDAFFDYLRDDDQQNIVYERNEKEGRFHFYQGSKIVRGEFNEKLLQAQVTLARMPQPSVAVMRRLLEMNFNLYYGRYALDGDRLCMRFDSEIKTANPNKLYYGLKELATKADKQDDLLVDEFTLLQPLDTEHVIPIPEAEKEVKYSFLHTWIKETLDYINTIDAEKFSGGIAYLLLSLSFRIDYLLTPEGKLLHDLEKIVDIYYRKDEKPITDKNNGMTEGFKKIQDLSQAQVFPFLFRSKHVFSIVSPQNHKAVADAVNNAALNMVWYRDNNHSFIANKVLEYGFSFCQYSYSLPKPLSDLFRLFMHVNYGDYFRALGYSEILYDPLLNRFDEEGIEQEIEEIVEAWKKKYLKLQLKVKNLRYDSLVSFNHTYITEIGNMNFDA
ncbi:MAG: hypothetical protein H7122_08500 [Chitinophagaceae bacterium]|nr:hypothetical protein [Chitinophagaceae bacterium]